MVTVGIRELKQRASQLVRLVREKGDQVQVTHRGKVVALLVPVASDRNEWDGQHEWDSLDILAAEIGSRWPKGVSAAQALSEGRR